MTVSPIESDDLRSISSYDDALKLLAERGVEVRDASVEIGDGFTLTDKDSLLKVPFVLISWVFTKGDYGADFVTCRVVTEKADKVIFNDGGTGICAQLMEYSKRTGSNGGLLVRGGLRKSEYSNEHTQSATTYYLGV